MSNKKHYKIEVVVPSIKNLKHKSTEEKIVKLIDDALAKANLGLYDSLEIRIFEI
jgi:hypothetical protein